MISKQIIAQQLLCYLNYKIGLAKLVDWSIETLSQLANAEAGGFGLLWEVATL